VCEINGERTAELNEAARIAFQTGECDAVVFTVTESISLHRGELPGGDKARSLIVHDMRHSAIQLQQIEGRCHRDGERAVIYYAFAEDTVEERIAATVVTRMSAMDGMAGDDTSLADELARVIVAELMTEVLGYGRFGAQGGDWGSFITARLGLAYPDRLSGIHLNMLPVRRDPKMVSNPTREESRYLEELQLWLKEETGYQWIQGTRPQTLAFALTDSPVGLAAWIVEKFRAWSDCGGDIESVFTRDHLLANISLYWFTAAIGSSFWPYYARMHGPWPIPAGEAVTSPTGYCEFPREILRPPRSIAERTFTNIHRWTAMDRGGHFAAMERPEALAVEIREFFRPLRGS